MRLLAIEDDPVLADGLQVGLSACGWTVEVVGRVEDALAALESSAFDAVVLDLGLPDGDGLSVLRFVRERDMDVGVVVLSARDDSRDRIVGLDAGADDYVGKPSISTSWPRDCARCGVACLDARHPRCAMAG